MVAPEDRATYEKHLRALTPEHPTAAIEVRAILPDGSERWERMGRHGHFRPRRRDLVEIQSVGRDVTERKRAELALRESEARYRALVETQTEFVLRQLPEGRLTFVNEAYCRYVGKSRDELLVRLVQWARHDGAGISAQASKNICGSLRPTTRPHPWRLAPSSRTAPSVGNGGSTPGIFDANGRLVELQSTGRDSPNRKRSETGAARERGALSGRRRGSERVHPAAAPRRYADLRQ